MPLTSRARSLQSRLSLISVLLFVSLAAFGLFTIHLFTGFNELSYDLRARWLPSTRLLGDLNNNTSDYRAAEGDVLVASDAAERRVQLGVIADLGKSVGNAETDYERLPHSTTELTLYHAFARDWQTYVRIASQVAGLASSGQPDRAIVLYRTVSRSDYSAASDALGFLTARNVEQARKASERTAEAYRLGRLLILTALLSGAALLAAALAYIRHSISHPLTNLARTMRLLATNTTELQVAGADREDEIGEMARAVLVFRANAIELMQSQLGLSQQAAMLEQKLAYEQNLARQQRNFVSMISHEFRTPLTVIDAHAQRLVRRKDNIAPDELADRARRMRAAVHRITGLMDNLLNSSRLIDGDAKLFFHPAEFNLVALLREVCGFHHEIAPNASIHEEYDSPSLSINGDRKLLFQTFSNLLSNAIKYSPDPVTVWIKAREEAFGITATICDQGLGIPAQDLENLFTRYYRGSNVSGIVGTGVGLYLARTVVQLHGGAISVVSEDGRGACFTVSLPSGDGRSGGSRRSVTAVIEGIQDANLRGPRALEN